MGASEIERRSPVALDVIAVDQARRIRRHDGAQPELSLAEWSVPQVFAVEPQQIEGAEARLAAPEEQVSELRLASIVQADDLAVQNHRPRSQRLGNGLIQGWKGFELVAIA